MMTNHDMLMRLAIELEQDNRRHDLAGTAPNGGSQNGGEGLINRLARAYRAVTGLLA